MDSRLINLGFSDRYLQEAALYGDLFLARVIAQYRDLYKVATPNVDLLAEISGKLRYSADQMSDYPVVGDFVMVDRGNEQAGHSPQGGHAIIHHILTRKSVFVRRAAGTAQEIQVVAANIDTIFICIGLNNDFNIRRLERYLAIAWDSGAVPVIVLTKSDLCDDLPARLAEISASASGVDLLITSSMIEDGYRAVQKYIQPGQTVAFIGSSGVGKSTLINRLLGEDLIATREIRSNDKGKHATTRRELFVIPSGGAVMDTPGMRELGVESANLAMTFREIDELTLQCKFNDCQHEGEPGCAIRKAIDEGVLSEDRLASYKKLKKEARYEGLNSRQIDKEKFETMYSAFGGVKNARDYLKSRKKSR